MKHWNGKEDADFFQHMLNLQLLRRMGYYGEITEDEFESYVDTWKRTPYVPIGEEVEACA